MFTFPISNHPTITGITRKATVAYQDYNPAKTVINLILTIEHYVGTSKIADYNKSVPIECDNTVASPVEGKMMFDYFTEKAEAGDAYEVILAEAVAICDAAGLINLKCNYPA
jgi:hypothetical protein